MQRIYATTLGSTDRNRETMTAGGVTKTFHYDGDRVTYVTESSGKVYRFAYDHGGHPIFMSYEGNQYWYHYDEHGNVIRMTDINGNTVAIYKYDAWGNITSKWGPSGSEIVDLNPFRYAGYWYDQETGKYYLKARYYDSEIGRFLSKDPIIIRVGNDLSLNAYTYANNNPVMYVDPTGTDAVRTMGFLARFAPAAIVALATIAPAILIGAAVFVGLVAIGFAAQAVYNHFSSSGDIDEGHSNPAKATNDEAIVDVKGEKNWGNAGSKEKYLKDNNYIEDAPQWTGDMNKSKVRDKDGNPVGEIHSGQPEYDYKQTPKVSTGKKYPDHFQEYNTKGKLKKLHKYFEE